RSAAIGTQLRQRHGRDQSLARAHRGLQQGDASLWRRFVGGADDVSRRAAAPHESPDLLLARPRLLAGTELHDAGRVAIAAAANLHELVDRRERRRVAYRRQRRADAEAIDGRAGGDEWRDAMLVEVAGRDDFRRPKAALIEDAPHLPAERVEIAAGQTPHRRPQPGRP